MTGAMSSDSSPNLGSMPEQLHLPSLSITNFRGIENLELPRLGRVTLIAGRNGVGKTTVLEAVQVYAAKGRYEILSALLQRHEESINVPGEERDLVTVPNIAALFHGREPDQESIVAMGPTPGKATLTLQRLPSSLGLQEDPGLFAEFDDIDDVFVLKVQFQDMEEFVPWVAAGTRSRLRRNFPARRFWRFANWPDATTCQSLGPGPLDSSRLASLFSDVALTKEEDRIIEALRLLPGGEDIERVAAVVGSVSPRENRILVKIAGQDSPVPLRSLGDGMALVFGVALALANSHNGFLVIDEAENGIHYTAQRDFWRLLLRTAQRNNVQVLATTHSWDCVAGFARAACELDDVEGVLVRLEEDEDGLRAVEYTESDLAVAAEQRIEVR